MRLRSVVMVVLTLSVLPALASAQNLIENPDFDVDLAGWTPTGSTRQTWISDDAPLETGSMEVALENSGPFGEQGFSQSNCIPVDAGEVYSASGWLKVDPASPVLAAELIPLWFASADCTGAALGEERGLKYLGVGDWEFVERTDLVAPVGAASVAVTAYVFADFEPGGVAVARYDTIFLPEPSPAAAPLAAGLALVALARLSGRGR